MTTIKDIAKSAHVSPATVSNALNPDLARMVAPETLKRIKKIASDLGYQPVHHRIKQVTTQTNCALITTLFINDEIEDEYWHFVRKGIYETARKRNVNIQNVFQIQVGIDPGIVANYDGVIILGSLSEQAIKRLKHYNPNIIVIDDVNTNCSFVDTIGTDLYNLTLKALNLLKKQANGPIAFIGGYRMEFSLDGSVEKKGDDLRTQAYRDWLAVNHQSKLMKLTSWNTQAGLSAINELLSEVTAPIGGLLVASDSMAIGVVKGLLERQIVPGKDLPLISFDNIHVASFLTPAITSFSLPKEVLGITAVNQICDLITHHRQWISRTTIPGHLGTGETYPLQTC
ncbi:LacI family DNA-binding transcriptional regulator [Secundilactobacillus silagei]|uniref:LacI family transcriptional regulator n=1 Tax=Secundilactobacillus silagei JCM 19001 TaxID=1302250 RepID=A0A1Z5IIB5_9LACO|nr:LacI family DNA-binding transcriptional regulator [Secundilactobacillus silagei]TDG67369.1 hypothetical protein C5L25_000965 [Secundilactobacillus silagei JCM 19001]GAX01312.1 LacI family transcriptional regulator [Secundilactobacillus silagei JCM 19001]